MSRLKEMADLVLVGFALFGYLIVMFGLPIVLIMALIKLGIWIFTS